MVHNANNSNQDALRAWIGTLSLLASCMSGLACTWQLIKMRRVHGAEMLNLVERQLWHLAAADFCFAFFSIPYCFLSLFDIVEAHDPTADSFLNYMVCGGLGIMYSTGLNTSIVLNGHLALGFAAAVSHKLGILAKLRRSLPWLWLAGLTLGFFAVISGEFMISVPQGYKHYRCYLSNNGITRISAILVAVSFIWCAFAYTICFMRVSSSGEALKARGWRRAQLYPVVVLLTFGPAILVAIGILPETFVFIIISSTCVCLTGLFNTFVYIIQRWFALRSESRYVSIGDLLLPVDLRYEFTGNATPSNRAS